jgi:putative Mg2+ transporter-C (MgtC) family protein
MFLEFFDDERVQAVFVSILCGCVIGFEREYRNKSAGFRTVVLICFGSTVFTMVSMLGENSDDRIAANIVTGIGFLGAGVIFKGKVSVLGLTTAAVIWSMAAIGMVIGTGEFVLAFFLTACMFVILAFFHKIERVLSSFFFTKTIYITFQDIGLYHLQDFEELLLERKVKVARKGLEKRGNHLMVVYDISGRRSHIQAVNEKIVSLDYVYEFTYS